MKAFFLTLAAVSISLGTTDLASAQYHPHDIEGVVTGLELTAGLGVMGHNSTGAPIDDYGYEAESGPAADIAVRVLFGDNTYVRQGFTVRGAYFAGRGFGRRGYAYRFGLADLTYTARTLLPCMSHRDGARFYASGSLGITGGYADAGTGRGSMNADYVARTDASRDLDHGVLGWVLGGTAEMHYGKMLVGVSFDLRRLWGIDSRAGSTWVRSGSLRFGYRFDGGDEPEARQRERASRRGV